jgi:hypothetical protein
MKFKFVQILGLSESTIQFVLYEQLKKVLYERRPSNTNPYDPKVAKLGIMIIHCIPFAEVYLNHFLIYRLGGHIFSSRFSQINCCRGHVPSRSFPD